MELIPEQMELRRAIPRVKGNVDYQTFLERLERIDQLLTMSGLERQFVEKRLEEMEKAAEEEAKRAGRVHRQMSAKEQGRAQRMLSQALRCNLARQLTEKEYRRFSRRVAESALLQWFCRAERLDEVRVPSKSALDRYDKLASESEVRALVYELNRLAAEPTGAKGNTLGLEEAAGIETYFADTTCLKANIHFPVDWVLLRDAARTLMKAVFLIRRHGLKNRMAPPEEFLRQMNRLSIEMTQSRRKSGSKKERKRILRSMKRLSKLIGEHARRHIRLLEERWSETDWTERQAQQVIRRMTGVLQRLPQAIWQAHERIIGDRSVRNDRKLLSLYESDLHVIVRGKADAEVEFGNTLFLAEQWDGLIVDWKLLKDQAPTEGELLQESLRRVESAYGRLPMGVATDRGFDGPPARQYLEDSDIYNAMCPRSPKGLRERMQEDEFVELQRRRAQTEARIGIVQNVFMNTPPRSKGFEHRDLAVAWAVLGHNLWALARLLQAEAANRKKAA